MHAARAQPVEMPLADQQPGRRRLLLLRERASQRTALLPGARAHCISVGRSAAQQRGCVAYHRSRAAERRDELARLHSITSSATTTMFAVLRGRALSRLEIDDELEFHGLLDWQVVGLFAFESRSGLAGWQGETRHPPRLTAMPRDRLRGCTRTQKMVPNYPFERSHRFPVIQPNSGRRGV